MARFRLRFQLHEVDLQRAVSYLGRSEECEITLEDPLVSRKHARIVIAGDDVTLEDLGSRNGVSVNGEAVKSSSSRKLVHGDRVRIGSMDFVFSRAERSDRPARKTGAVQVCESCGAPYMREAVSCPSCGSGGTTGQPPGT